MRAFQLLFCVGILTLGNVAFADEPQAEVAKVVGSYQLSKAVRGNCPASILVEEDRFNTTSTVGLGVYGDQPGDVVIQLDSLNSGKASQREENPMSGAFNGTESQESTIGNGQIAGYSENDDAAGEMRFRYDFSATYGNGTLSYEVKYAGAFNGIAYDNVCEFSVRQQMVSQPR